MSSPPAPTSATKRARRKQARPSELLDAALDLFVEKGFAATKVEDVATRAGVSKGTLFLYFPSKDDLFRAVVHENLASRFVEWNAEYESFVGSSADMLRHCLQVWWMRVGTTKATGITKLVMNEAHSFPEVASYYHAEVIRPAQALIRRVIQRGIDSGEFRHVDADYAVYSVTCSILYIVTLKHSMAVFVPEPERMVPERYIASHLDIILGGLLRHPPGPPL